MTRTRGFATYLPSGPRGSRGDHARAIRYSRAAHASATRDANHIVNRAGMLAVHDLFGSVQITENSGGRRFRYTLPSPFVTQAPAA